MTNHKWKSWIGIFLVGIAIGWLIDMAKKSFNSAEEWDSIGEYYCYFHSPFSDTLVLMSRNDECGEFGGTLEIMEIFSKVEDSFVEKPAVHAEYNAYDYCGPQSPLEEMKPLDTFTNCDLSEADLKLVVKAAQELIEMKLMNFSMIPHSGKQNHFMTKDASILIEDYSSSNWFYFKKLKKQLEKRKCKD